MLSSFFRFPAFFFLITTLFIIAIQNSRAEENASPKPGGEMRLMTCSLPKSQSTWDYKEGIPALGKPVPVDTTQKEDVPYWIFLPASYKAEGTGSPLLLFLHGAGERGTDGKAVAVHGPPMLLKTPETRKDWPFLTISPQCKPGYCWSPEQLLKLLDAVEKQYHVDKSRVYVTGLSMGGFGTWMLLDADAKRFAAAAPVCGGGNPDWAKNMLETPVWAFHGDADGVVPPDGSRKMIDALEKQGSKKAKLTIYPGVGHNSWSATYANPELYTWFLSHATGK